MIKRVTIVAVAILVLYVVDADAGNKTLMARAKAKLIALNNRVLRRIPEKAVPEKGYVKVKADIKGRAPTESITITEIKTTSDKPIAK